MFDDSALAIFVKTPGLSTIKTRLAADIGPARALEFYGLAIEAIQAVAVATEAQLGLTAYWAVAEEDGLQHPMWSGLQRIGQGTGGLGTRLHTVYHQLRQRHSRVLLIGADSPQLSITILRSALNSLDSQQSGRTATQFALGRSTDGGYYLFGGREPVPQEIWEAVPYSVETTAAEFIRLLEPLGTISELPDLCDVDTIGDLRRLGQISCTDPDLLPEQIRVIEWAAAAMPVIAAAESARPTRVDGIWPNRYLHG